jgi:Glycosyl hydrolases family 38 N-terminal domain
MKPSARNTQEPSTFPKFFQGGSILIVPSSHQDIGWMDSIERCIEQRDRQVITQAMTLMGKDPGYRFSLEDTLLVMDYLKRHPDRKEQMGEFVRKGQLASAPPIINLMSRFRRVSPWCAKLTGAAVGAKRRFREPMP